MQPVSHSPCKLTTSRVASNAKPKPTPLAKIRAQTEPTGRVSPRSYDDRLAEGFAMLAR